ncbi:hypothetical protein [Niabella aquatica]
MNKYSRDIIFLVKDTRSVPPRVEHLNEVIACVDNIDGFCNAHELVNRNHITSKRNKILAAVQKEQLKPFRFLINKN